MKLHRHPQRGIYFIQFTDSTKNPPQKRVYFTKNRRESITRRNEYLDRYRQGLVDPWGEPAVERALREAKELPKAPTPIREAFKRFIAEKERNTRPANVARYRAAIQPLLRTLPDDAFVHDVTTEMIEAFVFMPHIHTGEQKSAATLKNNRDRIGIFFEWCAVRGYIGANPVAPIVTPNVKKALLNRKKYLTRGQASKLLSIMRQDAHPRHWWVGDLAEFDMLTALRRQEITSLRWRHITRTRSGGRITFTEDDYHEIPLKSVDSIRWIKLTHRAMEILDNLRRERGAVHEEDFIFMDDNGPMRGRGDHVSKTVKSYLKAASLGHMDFHGLRHTAITWWVNGGVPIHLAKQMAGHSDINVTQGYLHADPLDADRVIPDEIMDLRL